MLTLRTIISRRAADWAVRYHFCSSRGALAVTLSFSFKRESTLLVMMIVLSSLRR